MQCDPQDVAQRLICKKKSFISGVQLSSKQSLSNPQRI